MTLQDLRFKLREPNVQFTLVVLAIVAWIVFVVLTK